jgi:hypothetical protein
MFPTLCCLMGVMGIIYQVWVALRDRPRNLEPVILDLYHMFELVERLFGELNQPEQIVTSILIIIIITLGVVFLIMWSVRHRDETR